MRGPILVFVQLLMSYFLVGAMMPVVLLTMPVARDAKVGLVLTGGLVAAIFVTLRLVWSRTSRH